MIELAPNTTVTANTFHLHGDRLVVLPPLVVVEENLSATIAILEPGRDFKTLLHITARPVLHLLGVRTTGRRCNSNSNNNILDEQIVITIRRRLQCLLMQHLVLRPPTQVTFNILLNNSSKFSFSVLYV
jgi:hypothetical protein